MTRFNQMGSVQAKWDLIFMTPLSIIPAIQPAINNACRVEPFTTSIVSSVILYLICQGAQDVRALGPWKSNGALVKFCLRALMGPEKLVIYFIGGTRQILLGVLGNSNGGLPIQNCPAQNVLTFMTQPWCVITWVICVRSGHYGPNFQLCIMADMFSWPIFFH